ncbi:DUF6482 family protein [Colwelliaceae bacterium BS250]
MSNVNTSNGKNVVPTIIGVADSPHYLVGAVDSVNNFIGLNQADQIDVFSSIVEAKNYLRGHNIYSAALEFQSAYDEMCGSSPAGRCSQMISF